MVEIIKVIMALLVIAIFIMTLHAGYKVLRESVPKENHCLQEELTYYRIEGGLFSHRVDTKEENSDGSYYKCLRWEELNNFKPFPLV